MQKPNNYDATQTTGDFTPIELGGHHLVIKKVEEAKTKAGKDMIIVAFDMAPGDNQAGYFSDLFANDIRADKKWPRNGRQYIVVNDQDGNCSRNFKSFITSIEKSNNGFVTEWGDKFASQFKDKRIGGVFGEVENEYNGKTTMRHELRWFCEDSKAGNAQIPSPRYLPNSNKTVSAPADPSGFMAVPENAPEEIPF